MSSEALGGDMCLVLILRDSQERCMRLVEVCVSGSSTMR